MAIQRLMAIQPIGLCLLYNSLFFELGEILLVIAQRLKKLGIMLTELRRRNRMGWSRIAVFERKFNRTYRRLVFALDLDLQAHVLDLRIIEYFFQVINRRMRHVMGLESFQPVSTGLGFEKLSEHFA